MGFWTAIVVIVVIGCITSVFQARYRAHSGNLGNDGGNGKYVDRGDIDAQQEIAELRERIKVLERIATDANSTEGREAKAISEEIERLREE